MSDIEDIRKKYKLAQAELVEYLRQESSLEERILYNKESAAAGRPLSRERDTAAMIAELQPLIRKSKEDVRRLALKLGAPLPSSLQSRLPAVLGPTALAVERREVGIGAQRQFDGDLPLGDKPPLYGPTIKPHRPETSQAHRYLKSALLPEIKEARYDSQGGKSRRRKSRRRKSRRRKSRKSRKSRRKSRKSRRS